MKLILITLVAVVVGIMVACSSAPDAPAAPVAPPPPAYSDAEVIGAVRGFLNGPGMDNLCKHVAARLASMAVTVRQDPSNRDKYLVTTSDADASWMFIGSVGKVISTSKGVIGYRGC